MSMNCNDPLWIASPWPDDISDEMAEVLCNTFQALAMACDERYFHQLHSYYATRRAALCDPERPWMRKPVEPDHDWSPSLPESIRSAERYHQTGAETTEQQPLVRLTLNSDISV